MQRVMTTLSIAALLALASVGARAQSEAPKTREQVRQELADAIRDGTMPFGESGLTMRELFPSRYPKRVAAPTMPANASAATTTACASMPMAGGSMH